MSFMGIPQGEYKTGSNPRRQILAPNGKNVPTSYACMSTAGAQDVHFCASDIVRPETQNSLAEGGCQKGFLKKQKTFRLVHQFPACSCPVLVSTSLTTGKPRCSQTSLSA